MGKLRLNILVLVDLDKMIVLLKRSNRPEQVAHMVASAQILALYRHPAVMALSDTITFDGLDIEVKPIEIDSGGIRFPVIDRDDSCKPATQRCGQIREKNEGMIRQPIRTASEIDRRLQYPKNPHEDASEMDLHAAVFDHNDSLFG
jgi:hypothetical protein